MRPQNEKNLDPRAHMEGVQSKVKDIHMDG